MQPVGLKMSVSLVHVSCAENGSATAQRNYLLQGLVEVVRLMQPIL